MLQKKILLLIFLCNNHLLKLPAVLQQGVCQKIAGGGKGGLWKAAMVKSA
jgi:hypothetical protein